MPTHTYLHARERTTYTYDRTHTATRTHTYAAYLRIVFVCQLIHLITGSREWSAFIVGLLRPDFDAWIRRAYRNLLLSGWRQWIQTLRAPILPADKTWFGDQKALWVYCCHHFGHNRLIRRWKSARIGRPFFLAIGHPSYERRYSTLRETLIHCVAVRSYWRIPGMHRCGNARRINEDWRITYERRKIALGVQKLVNFRRFVDGSPDGWNGDLTVPSADFNDRHGVFFMTDRVLRICLNEIQVGRLSL